MPFRLLPYESSGNGIKRIADEQLERAVNELSDSGSSLHDRIHKTRKRMKKIRGVLRLARRPLGKRYKIENAWLRKTARSISELRDAQAVIETWDKIDNHRNHDLLRRHWASVKKKLEHRRDAVLGKSAEIENELGPLIDELQARREHIRNLPLDSADFEGLADGFKRTYRRGRNAMEDAYGSPTPGAFHEWRKRVKYHWYHLRILRDVWKPPLKGRQKSAKHLAGILGDEHDLTVLRELFSDYPELTGPGGGEAVGKLLDRRQEELRREAEALGKRLFADKPSRFTGRMEAYWNSWKEENTRA